MKRLIQYITLGVTLIFHMGCGIKEQPVCPGVPVDINIEVGSGTRHGTDIGEESERVIKRIRVMVFFKETGLIDKQAYMENEGGFETIPIEMNMQVWSGDKIFCVVANEPEPLKGPLDVVNRFSDLKNMTFGNESTYNTPGAALPMICVKEENVDPKRPLTTPVELTLKRIVGKVKMAITKDPANTHTVKLVSVMVINTPTESRLMPGSPITAPVLADLTVQDTFLPDELTVETPVTIAPKYLFEHYWGKGTPEAAVEGKATVLKVVISINKGSVPETETYYIPLIGAYDNSEPVYAVFRNTVANLSLTVLGDAIRVNYDVMEWSGEEYDKEPGKEDNSFTFEDWITPADYEVELR